MENKPQICTNRHELLSACISEDSWRLVENKTANWDFKSRVRDTRSLEDSLNSYSKNMIPLWEETPRGKKWQRDDHLLAVENRWQKHVREKFQSRERGKGFLREKWDENKKKVGWNQQNSEMMRSKRLFEWVRKALWCDENTVMTENSLENYSSERHFDKSQKTA